MAENAKASENRAGVELDRKLASVSEVLGRGPLAQSGREQADKHFRALRDRVIDHGP